MKAEESNTIANNTAVPPATGLVHARQLDATAHNEVCSFTGQTMP